ncbi:MULTISPECIES: helix-turn-helix domain-containing protein [unclassified Paenibacillus]|uniref:helix-turn-helix domain-containing protein n=1 Tax=unclassified Paenibacillus TaxID=185978 RepID=UPI002F3F82F4
MQAKKPDIIKAQRYFEQRITSKISLDEIAHELHMNPSYFSRLFRKETGETFVEYVTKLKIDRAKELLRWTNSSIETISESLGYDNKSYFSKLFKSVCGITPGEYREQNSS